MLINNRLKKIFSKLLTFYLPKKLRKKYRNKLYDQFLNFSISEYLKYKLTNYKFISLGDHCLVRMLLTGAKLKAQKKYGEKTCPFDLAAHKDIKAIVHLIKNDFGDFYDFIEYSYCDAHKKEIWHSKKFNSYYGHEEGLSFEQFKKRYDERIKNFIEYMNCKKKIYFVYSNYNLKENYPNKEDILNLYSVLKEKRGKKKFSLILLIAKEIDGINEKNIYQITEPDSDTFEKKEFGGLFQLLTIGGVNNPHMNLGYTDDALRYYKNVVKQIKTII